MDPITAGILGGGSLIGGILGSNAAKDAAKTQANAALQAAQIQAQNQQDILSRIFGMQRPYMRLGNEALNTLAMLQGLKPTAPTRYGYSRLPDFGWVKNNPLYALAKDIPQPGSSQGSIFTKGAEGMGINPNAGRQTGAPGLTVDEVMQAVPGLNRKQAEEAVGLYEKYGDRALAGIIKYGALGKDAKVSDRYEQVGNFAIADKSVKTEYGTADLSGVPKSWLDMSAEPPDPFEANLKDFRMSPDYKAQYNLGMQAMDRQNAALGEGLSGRQIAAAQKFGQQIGSSAYSDWYNRNVAREAEVYNRDLAAKTDWYNRLAGMAGLGPSAAGVMGGALQQTSTYDPTANAMVAAANAGAAGQLGASNAWANALNQGLGVFGAYQQGKQDDAFQNQLLGLLQGGGGGGGGYPMGGWGVGGASIGGMTAGDFAYQPNFVTQ